ncbi:MAG: hypothetical protein IJD78_04585 [Clostridia bacterium]|nr:hypothetical protein [Clostridia bacterium]
MNKSKASVNKTNLKNILFKTVVIAVIAAAFVLFVMLYDYSYMNDGSEIFQLLKNGG